MNHDNVSRLNVDFFLVHPTHFKLFKKKRNEEIMMAPQSWRGLSWNEKIALK
jgi:hypothetical protein